MMRVGSTLMAMLSVVSAATDLAPLQQDAYVWQRAWTAPVTNAVRTLAPKFGELIALQAEVSWEQGNPCCTRVDLDYAALRASGRPVGLALRIGSFSGSFAAKDPPATYLAGLCQTLVAEANANQLQPTELQLDFDCAESKLTGYRTWLTAIRKAVHPLPVTLTALPSWLNQSTFKELVTAADGYVLQVHSFERPRDTQAVFTLCDPQAARRAMTRAAALGRPFRVALPTYGYLAAFDAKGQFLGLSAEGPARNWPATAQVVEIRADPRELSRLVREWSGSRPEELLGVIWYRLPVASDVLNWTWPTLESVMAGEEPAADLRAHVQRVKPGLVEIELANEGAADVRRLPSVIVRWEQNRRIAADGIGGFQLVASGPVALRLNPPQTGRRLSAGERMKIAWIRFDGDPELKIELDERSN